MDASRSLGFLMGLRRVLTTVCASLTVLVSGGYFVMGPAHADIYQWTDADGVVHFTNRSHGASSPGAKLYMKGGAAPSSHVDSSTDSRGRGFVPFAPQDIPHGVIKERMLFAGAIRAQNCVGICIIAVAPVASLTVVASVNRYTNEAASDERSQRLRMMIPVPHGSPL